MRRGSSRCCFRLPSIVDAEGRLSTETPRHREDWCKSCSQQVPIVILRRNGLRTGIFSVQGVAFPAAICAPVVRQWVDPSNRRPLICSREHLGICGTYEEKQIGGEQFTFSGVLKRAKTMYLLLRAVRTIHSRS